MIEFCRNGIYPVYLFHMPKTGGMAFQHILKTYFDKETICTAQTELDLRALSANQLKKYKLFAGHFWGLKRKLSTPVRMFTILRNPSDRAISMYYHILRDRHHRCHEWANSAEFEKVVKFPAMKNAQVRHLARCSVEYSGETLSDELCLPLAKQILKDCCYVGFSFDLNGVMRDVVQIFGLGDAKDVPLRNTRKERGQEDTLDESQKLEICRNNGIDNELYDWARNHFSRSNI